MKPALRKKVAGYLQDRYRVSTRKAALNACIARATMYYRKKSDPHVHSLRIAMRDAASKRPRFGWRRILVLVRRARASGRRNALAPHVPRRRPVATGEIAQTSAQRNRMVVVSWMLK